MTTRRNIIKAGAGLAAILASGKAPAYLIKSMLAARNSIGLGRGGGKLPYDAEVAYLESQPTGGQYINTDYLFTSDNVEVTASLYSTQSSGQVLFGSEQTISSKRTLTPLVYTDSGNMFSLFYAQNARVIRVNSLSAGNYDLTIKASNRTVQFCVNGTTTSASYSGECLKTLPIYLFAEGFTTNVSYYAKGMKLYGFTIKDNGVLVRDFHPVRFTNELGQSEGAMYDRVSGELEPFRNRGTGAFLWGSDASAQNGGGYNLICLWCAYTRSSRPSARCWRAAA